MYVFLPPLASAREGPQLLLQTLLSYFWEALDEFLSVFLGRGLFMLFFPESLCWCPLLTGKVREGLAPDLVSFTPEAH